VKLTQQRWTSDADHNAGYTKSEGRFTENGIHTQMDKETNREIFFYRAMGTLFQVNHPEGAFLARLQNLDNPIIQGSHSLPAAKQLQSLIVAALAQYITFGSQPLD
jgi:hypothetical protein